MTTLSWVVGRGGLLGAQIERAAQQSGHVTWAPSAAMAWDDSSVLLEQLKAAAAEFFSRAAAYDRWMLFWSAGSGVVGTPAEQLIGECENWENFLALLTPPSAQPGLIFLASSAGGIYAGADKQDPSTERTPPAPLSPYGVAKLRHERALEAWSERHGVAILIGRIANLYGLGQNLLKSQGFISHLARCLIHNSALHVYVPLDTMRDFVFSEDCAREIVQLARYLIAQPASRIIKILATEQTVTLGLVVHQMAAVARRSPKLVCSIDSRKQHQPAALRFRSEVLRAESAVSRTSLMAGMARVYQHQMGLFRDGKLPRPPTH